MTGKRLIKLSAAALLAASLIAPPAQGQVQVQNGAAHDANQQVGSGGYNSATQQPDYRVRNLLITGNVGGGRAFQGQIDYTAAGTFQGSLGSDALFNFQRDSILSNPSTTGYAARGLGNRVIVTRPTTSIPGYRVQNGNALSTRTNYYRNSGTLTFRQSGGGLVGVTGLSDLSTLNLRSNALGLINTPQGLIRIEATPLTGIRYNPLDANTGSSGITPQRPPEANEGFNPLEDGPLNNTTTPSNRIDTDASLSTGRRIDGTYRPAADDFGLSRGNAPADPLAIQLGSQVQSAFALQLAGRDNNNPNARAQAIRAQVFGPTAGTDTAKPPTPPTRPQAPTAAQNPYEKLIADIMARADPENPFTKKPEEGPAANNWQAILQKPDDEELKAKRSARDTVTRITLGLIDDEGNVDYDTPLPSINPDSELGKLLKDLKYDLPRMRSLTDDSGSRISKLMKTGEKDLKDGRYLTAENVYRQVLRSKPDDALAKAGLVHSQMGAGMIRSAAFNLRSLFAKHPELVALRYDAKLMPDADRLRWLQGRLQKMIGENNRGADPGLVLAYLGYQLEAKPLIEYGLDVAETEAPRDPLMPLLRSIWLDGK